VAKLEFFPRTEFLRGVATVTVFRDHIHGQLSASPAHGWFDSFTFWILAAEWNRRCRRFLVLSGFVLGRSLDSTAASYVGNLP
jgi:peptidoglycan/LPS O-acetylase OafA/YrhL